MQPQYQAPVQPQYQAPAGQQVVYPNPPVQQQQGQGFNPKKPDLSTITSKIDNSGIKNDKKKLGIIIGACAAVVIVLIIIISVLAGGSAKKTVNAYMKAMEKGDGQTVVELSAYDWKGYYTDYYSRDNLEAMIEDDNSYYGFYDDVDEIYEYAEENFDYSGSIESGSDYYKAFVEQASESISDMEIEEYEITNVKDIDITKDIIEGNIEHYEELCDDTDLDGKKYFDGKKVKKAKKVTVKYKDADGRDSATFYVVKYGNSWKVLDEDI